MTSLGRQMVTFPFSRGTVSWSHSILVVIGAAASSTAERERSPQLLLRAARVWRSACPVSLAGQNCCHLNYRLSLDSNSHLLDLLIELPPSGCQFKEYRESDCFIVPPCGWYRKWLLMPNKCHNKMICHSSFNSQEHLVQVLNLFIQWL